MNVTKLTHDAVLRVGEVAGVDGRRVYVLVDRNKNLSDMFFDGDILRNISVNSYKKNTQGLSEPHRPGRRRKDRRGLSCAD
jgi:hypothetical protein